MTNISRREFFKFSALTAGMVMMPRMKWLEAATLTDDPHFFIQVVLDHGADCTYMFDARPLAMTGAGKIQNYTGTEASVWMGANGQQCLASSLTAPLTKFKDRLTILNGVMMDSAFDGHNQNMNYLFAGNPFGGDSFIPHLNQAGSQPAPLDGIQQGFLAASLQNLSGVVPLTPDSSAALAKRLTKLPPAKAGTPMIDFIRSRYVANSSGTGRFAGGTELMLKGLDGSSELQMMMAGLKVPDATETADAQFVDLVTDAFKNKMSRSATWVFPEQIDTHAPEQAKMQPQLFKTSIERLALLFQKLVDTPFDSTRSMLDVTTVMVTSEFSRTMRNKSLPIDQTGTNHNPLNNSVIVAGKGIKAGCVFGASDFATANETLSGAHLAIDQDQIKMMARPFDFTTGQPRTDLPKAFDVTDYLTIGSVVNTLYSMFGVSNSKYRVYSRTQPQQMPVLSQLLA